MGLSKHLNKKEDNYSVGSKKKLFCSMRHKIKRTMVGALDAIEKELDTNNNKNQQIFKRIRSKILGLGNDQIRNIELELDRYNIEYIPYNITFIQPQEGFDLEEGFNGR